MFSKKRHIAKYNRSFLQRKLSSKKVDNGFFLIDDVAHLLEKRLQEFNRTFFKILWVGRLPSFDLKTIFNNDVSIDVIADPFDELANFYDKDYDVVISHLQLHHVNDVLGYLLNANRCLKKDGLFLCSFFGGASLCELRQCLMDAQIELQGGVSPRVSPMISLYDASSLIQRAQFALPVVDHELINLAYDNFFDLLYDLRESRETSILEQGALNAPKKLFVKTQELYQNRFLSDNKLVATVDIIFMTGWRICDTQQKALKPGDSKIKLNDVL